MSAALGCNNGLSFSSLSLSRSGCASFERSWLHAFLTHFVETFAGVQYSTFRPFEARSSVARVVSVPPSHVLMVASTVAVSPTMRTVPRAVDQRHPAAQSAQPVGDAETDAVWPSSLVVITIWPMPLPPPSPRHTPLSAATTSATESTRTAGGLGSTDVAVCVCVGTGTGTGTGTDRGNGCEYATARDPKSGS